jgi:hypothetical protein
MIRARPSGLRRRFFLAAFPGTDAAAAVAFRTAARRFLCAAVLRRRAAWLTMRFGASSRERDRPPEALRPSDQHPDAATGPRRSRLRRAERGAGRRAATAVAMDSQGRLFVAMSSTNPQADAAGYGF